MDPPHERLAEIRLFGPLRVRRRDGTTVASSEWRTSKTRELLRLLALRPGLPLPVDLVLDALWPDVEAHRARARLRTATWQVRAVLGADALVRQADALVLGDVWVDVDAFMSLAEAVRAHLAKGELSEAVRQVREAAALYVGDVAEDEPYAEWLQVPRQRLRATLRDLLAEAAEAAVELCWPREAVALAQRCIELDPTAERAFRALMRAHAGLGETEQALRVYDRCRAVLADELGADPSTETQTLHLELLAGSRALDRQGPLPLVGRAAQLATLLDAVEEAVGASRTQLVLLTGPPGIGKRRLLDELAGAGHDPSLVVACDPAFADIPLTVAARAAEAAGVNPPAGASALEMLLAALPPAGPCLVRIEDLQWMDATSAEGLRWLLTTADRPCVVVATMDLGERARVFRHIDEVIARLDAAGRLTQIRLEPLGRGACGDLLAAVVQGQPSPRLRDHVLEHSRGVPFKIIEMGRDLAAGGQLVASGRGLEIADRRIASDVPRGIDAILDRARRQLLPPGLAALDTAAVLGGTFTLDLLHALLDDYTREDIRAGLDTLEDLGIVDRDERGYRFRHALLRDAAYRWLRPSQRRKRHEAVARRARIPAAARVEHWLAADEPRRALEAALQGAEEASARGADASARALLLRARELVGRSERSAVDHIQLLEAVADASERLGRIREAESTRSSAIELARREAPERVSRLCRKQGNLAGATGTPDDALCWYERAFDALTGDLGEAARLQTTIGWSLSVRSTGAAATALESAVDLADESGELENRVRSRAMLASLGLAPARLLDAALGPAREAREIALASGDAALVALALTCRNDVLAYLGAGAEVLDDLRAAWVAAGRQPDSSVRAVVGLPLCFAAHETGLPEARSLWPMVRMLDLRWRLRRDWRWFHALMDHERGDEATSLEWALGLDVRRLDPIGAQLSAIHGARLLLQADDVGLADALLRRGLAISQETGAIFLAPELAARLALLTASSDEAEAVGHLEFAKALAGPVCYPRERVVMLRARAAIHVAREAVDEAVTVLSDAVDAAADAGLVYQQAEALTVLGNLRRHLGHPDAARVLESAGRLYGRTGTAQRLQEPAELRPLRERAAGRG